MNTDADPFAGYEPNTTGGTEDLGGGFDLAGAAGRAARTGSVFGAKRSRDSIITSPTETQTNPTILPLPDEEGGNDTAEPEDPSTEPIEKGVGWKSRVGCFTCQTCENASYDRISRFAASQSVARPVHDPVEDVGERDQPRVLRQSL